MTYQEIHGLVAHGEKLPPFQPLPDRLCYECLKNLKKEYETTGGDEKRLRKGKQEIRRAHEEYSDAFRQYMEVYKEYSDNCLKTEQGIKRILNGLCTEAPNYKELFELAIDCIGRMQHDDTTVRIIRARMQP